MTKPQMTKNRIIDETVHFYASDPSRRSISRDGKTCFYHQADKKTDKVLQCAVGRCLTDSASVRYNGTVGGNWNTDSELDNALQKRYRGHSREFWDDIQGLHDASRNWTKTGLSNRGRIRVRNLKQKWSNAG